MILIINLVWYEMARHVISLTILPFSWSFHTYRLRFPWWTLQFLFGCPHTSCIQHFGSSSPLYSLHHSWSLWQHYGAHSIDSHSRRPLSKSYSSDLLRDSLHQVVLAACTFRQPCPASCIYKTPTYYAFCMPICP